jgi:glycosyltransferase involved in cell wall biosynthesis
MRLCVAHRGYFPATAGAELMAHHLAESMARRGYLVRFCTEAMDAKPASRMTSAGVTIGALADAAGSDELPDLVHAVDAVWPDYPLAALGLARRWGVPFAFTPASAPGTWQDGAAVLDVCRQSDAVFALTESEQRGLLGAGVARSVLHVIGQGPHLPARGRPARFRAEHGVSGPMVLFLGRKMRSKGYLVLLEAARLVWPSHPAARFFFIGPRLDSDCAAVFAEHADPRVTELGMVSEAEKADALAACDVFCLPSTVDVFPLVFVEAWASGKPVVGSAFPGADEVVRDGVDGLLAAPTAASVAAAIGRLLSDPVEGARLGERGRARVLRELGWANVSDRIETVYADLLATAGWPRAGSQPSSAGGGSPR